MLSNTEDRTMIRIILNNFKMLHLILALFLLSSCLGTPSSSNSNSSNPISNGAGNTSGGFSDPGVTTTTGGSTTGGSTGTGSQCDAPGVGTAAIDYYKIPIFLNGPPLTNGYQGVATWNSSTMLPDPSIFSTDTKFKARIRVYPSPTAFLYAYCNFNSPYDILSTTMDVY